MRGEAPNGQTLLLTRWGRSPRARGSRRVPSRLLGTHGSIPACAGKPSGPLKTPSGPKVDPRVRGEAFTDALIDEGDEGRSPRARGSHQPVYVYTLDGRSIPACAGKPQWPGRRSTNARVDPRVRGEAENVTPLGAVDSGRSPRARGSPTQGPQALPHGRSIPACAGKPADRDGNAEVIVVDPRVRGEAARARQRASSVGGRSPRARGSLQFCNCVECLRGSIPACAGKPAGGGRIRRG